MDDFSLFVDMQIHGCELFNLYYRTLCDTIKSINAIASCVSFDTLHEQWVDRSVLRLFRVARWKPFHVYTSASEMLLTGAVGCLPALNNIVV